MEEASVGWANGTMNAITQMVMTGKADFKSLASSIIADIIRINLQKAASSALASAGSWMARTFAFADGGIMTAHGSVPLKKYAVGGIANSPQLALFGEGSMPEAYVPLPDGRSIPVTMKGGSIGGTGVVINITVNKDGGESTESEGLDAQMYRRMGERIKSVVREELSAQKRPGGMLYT
jgi:phage-related minor tail protein